MMNTSLASTKVFIGIDGGGTKCKARIESDAGQLLGEGVGGPANIMRGLANTTASIHEAIDQALSSAGLQRDMLAKATVGLGLAGANVPSAKEQILAWDHPFERLHIATDLHIACLGAHDGNDGAVMICGTGFNAGLCKNNECTEIGGYGLLLGDNASGAGMGLRAVRLTLEVLDGIKPSSTLSDSVLTQLQCTDAGQLLELTINAKPRDFGQLAPLVISLAKQDHEAEAIVNEAASYIEKYMLRLQRLSPARIAMIGGLSKPMYSYLSANIQQLIQPVIKQPEEGAIIFAKQNQQSQVS